MLGLNYLTIFVCIWSLTPQYSLQDRYERRILYDLLDEYDTLERPVEHFNDTLLLSVGMTLVKILDVDEQNKILITSSWLTIEWQDANLRWNSSDHEEIAEIHIPSHRIWTPEVLMVSSADEGFTTTHGKNVIVRNNGFCVWNNPAIFKSSCKMDLTYFPFDTQSCEIKFRSWSYNSMELSIQMRKEKVELLDSNPISNRKWILKETAVKRTGNYSDGPSSFDEITFTIFIQRDPSFYLYSSIIPCVFAVMASLLVFLLSPDSGAKLTFGIIILMYLQYSSSTVFLTSTPLFYKYLPCLQVLVMGSLVASTFVLNLHFHTPLLNSPMPHWIRFLFVQKLPKYLCLQKPNFTVDEGSECNSEQAKLEDSNCPVASENVVGLISNEFKKMTRKIEKEERIEQMKSEWRCLAAVVDRLCFILFTTITCIFLFLIKAAYQI